MADLRIVDSPEIPTEDITGEEKLPTGGSGNYSISLDSLADYTKTKKDLSDNTTVDNKVNGVRQELDAHIEDLLNPHQVTKGQIGLGNVDNTADADKPVSNSAQAAIISAVSPKADKTYVDNQLTLKANKADVYTKAETYTKQESSDLVNSSISTALTPVNASLDLAKRGVANRYDSSLTYNSGERAVLANGDIVKSTIDGNANDPNVDMTGWYNPAELQRLLSIEQVSFTTLGIIPNTGTDLTLKINQALITHRNLFTPNGDYVVSSIEIPSNTVITTQGRGVRFIQKAGSGEGTRVIKVVGSNVYVLPCIGVKGNIATDPNEQNHAIYIQANATTGNINNVNIGDVYAEDIRGDAVYFGQATGAQYKLTNVTVGNVSFDNVYRNGVSVVSCNGFNIKSVVGKRVGMMDIDIEANIASGVCVNGYIGFVKGKCIGGIAQTQTDFVDNVIFDRVELSYTDYVNSTPEYPSYYKIPVLYRNIKSMTINELIIDGCDGYAISRIEGDAPLANTPLRIGKLTLKNACKVNNAENGIIKGGHVIIDYLDMDFSGLTDRSLFYAGSNYVVNKADVNFAANCSLFRATTNSKISKLTTKSTELGRIFNGGSNGSIEDSTANIERIFGSATKGLMINCNFTAVTPFAGGDNHTAINTGINGSYYANGLTQYGYLNCLRMGVFHLWVGSDGKLRIKSGAPTSDTDGALIGNQGLSATVAYDPPSLAASGTEGDSVTTTVPLTGAAVGNIVQAAFSQYNAGIEINAVVSSTNTVTVNFKNTTAAPIDLPSGTLIVKLI